MKKCKDPLARIFELDRRESPTRGLGRGLVYSVINLATRKSCINVIGERPGYRIQGAVNPLLIEHLDFLTVGSWMFTSSSRSCENTRCRCAFEREIGICCYTVRHPGACGQVRPMRDGQERVRESERKYRGVCGLPRSIMSRRTVGNILKNKVSGVRGRGSTMALMRLNDDT